MWRINFYFSLAFLFGLIQVHAEDDCVSKWTPIAPYFTSSVTGVSSETFNFTARKLRTVFGKSEHITTENFRDFNRNLKQRISRNTLVRPYWDFYQNKNIQQGEAFFSQILNSQKVLNTYLPVQVVTPENIYTRLKDPKDQLLFVKPGDKGLVISESVEALDEAMALMADQDVILEDGVIIPRGSILTPVMKTEKNQRLFESVVCTKQRKTLYSFVIENTGGEQTYMQMVALNPQTDGANLSPINLDHLNNAVLLQTATNRFYNLNLNLADIELDYRGFVRLPMKNEVENKNISGYAHDNTFVHYQGIYDPIMSDTWATVNTLCGVMKLAQEWKKTCKGVGCILQIGDMAFATGASSSSRKRDPLGHVGHDEGRCVDIRPIRKDDVLEKTDIGKTSYDREKTRQFINFAQSRFQVEKVITTDSKIKNVMHLKKHTDHVHMCFPETVNYCSMQ